ncbi:unnamed protein product [Clonostachys chloroleuca]|uniref:SET domain-containing protein n=1 Tax=Clonostachys chloroleuca TaxID=1926264 RepID=A0AA35LQH7_9HYPO|nr:unnamed protein product [Clonostachys chloroleuca]
MDIDDGSSMPEFIKMLHRQKENLRRAQAKRGEKPEFMAPRALIVAKLRLQSMAQRQNPSNDQCFFKTSFLPAAYPPSTESLDELKKMMIKDLHMELHHEGAFLVARSITPPTRLTGILTAVEDENQDVVTLQLYNQEKETERPVDDIIGEGTVVVLKNPYLKTTSDGSYGLRVDHLSDIIRLERHDERVPSKWRINLYDDSKNALFWKNLGNQFFGNAQYRAAIERYTEALKHGPTEDEERIIKLNRSMAFLKTQQFEAALSDIESAPDGLNLVEKALDRKTQALYGLEKYRECSHVLKEMSQNFAGNTSLHQRLARTIERVKEQERGLYDFARMQREASSQRPPHLDFATYIGPVEIGLSGSKGRGLFTTRAVKAGDLLLCEKAFAHAFVDTEGVHKQDLTVLIDAERDMITVGGQAELIRLVAQKIYHNPSMAAAVTGLHHGSYQPVDVTEVDGIPLVDTFLISRIISLNCFGCPLTTRDLKTRGGNQGGIDEKIHHSCGLWPMASYINHSCDRNATRAFIGDFMIVRATRDLDSGAELKWWYYEPGQDNKKGAHNHWGFQCDCAICTDDQATSPQMLAERKRLQVALKAQGNSVRAGKIESMLAKMKLTYRKPASEVPRLGMYNFQVRLAIRYLDANQPTKAVERGLEALGSLGFIIEGATMSKCGTSNGTILIKQWGVDCDIFKCWRVLSNAYSMLGAFGLASQAENFGKISYKACIGEDASF